MEKWLTNAFITCWCEYTTQDFMLKELQQLDARNICIGVIETTETEKEHFHIVVRFNRSIRFDTVRLICPKNHVEIVKSTNSIGYAMKNGVFYNDFDNEINNSDNIYIALVNDMLILTWKQLIKKYPKLVINNYTNILAMYKDINNSN